MGFVKKKLLREFNDKKFDKIFDKILNLNFTKQKNFSCKRHLRVFLDRFGKANSLERLILVIQVFGAIFAGFIFASQTFLRFVTPMSYLKLYIIEVEI